MADSKVNDILLFMSVAETGNFTTAGRAFGLSRSTAGKAVTRLEDRYGARLLNRTTRAVSLTEAGQRLYAKGEAIRVAIAAADARMEVSDGIPKGTLRIAAPDALGRRLVLPVIKKFQTTWPDIRFEISFSDTISRIVEDGFDLAIRVGVTTPDASLISRTLRMEKTLLCASPEYFTGRKVPKNIDQLSTHDLLQFSSVAKRQTWSLHDASSFLSTVSGRVSLRLDSAEGLREAALAGGAAPAVLNAANEVAVAAFLDGKIQFTQIAVVVANTLANYAPPPPATLADVMAIDTDARARASAMLESN